MGARTAMPQKMWAVTMTVALAASLGGALLGVKTNASAGTQQCNTECQSKMTDCILACDGMRSCEETCKKKGQSCVSLCSSDAGAAPPDDVADAALDLPGDREGSDARVGKDVATRRPARDR
jgi:hypothetical protein